jgi:N-methylhydantoinase A/oxoprolinase/acetone carboxylase beta subunit
MINFNILITTKDFVNHVCNYYKKIYPDAGFNIDEFDLVIEMAEHIDDSGNVIEHLAEHELNRMLRLVFKEKNVNIFICLKNSSINPLHEKIIYNLLQTAGYRNVTALHQK